MRILVGRLNTSRLFSESSNFHTLNFLAWGHSHRGSAACCATVRVDGSSKLGFGKQHLYGSGADVSLRLLKYSREHNVMHRRA